MEKITDIESDTEEDIEGFFLVPSVSSINISDRIAEANRKLFEDATVVDDENDVRPRRVQFCDNLVDFEPPLPDFYSDDAESVSSVEETREKSLTTIDELKESSGAIFETDNSSVVIETVEIVDEPIYDIVSESFGDEEDVVTANLVYREESPDKEIVQVEPIEDEMEEKIGVSYNNKVLVVLLPREDNSSFESVIGEDFVRSPEKECLECDNDSDNKIEIKETIEAKPRPKSAKSTKSKKFQKINCKMAMIAPELDCSVEAESKSWHETQNVKLKSKAMPKVEDSVKGKEGMMVASVTRKERPVSTRDLEKQNSFPVIRPKTAPSKRTCCVARTNLPSYNGLRSEYGLSAEQLQERRRKIAETKQQKKKDKFNKLQQTVQKRQENEAVFSEWLESKSSSSRSFSSNSKNTKKDTLVRSDVFIQNNAVYASKCGVAYAVNYSLGKTKSKIQEVRRKTASLGKLFENLSPHAQKTYRIYLDAK